MVFHEALACAAAGVEMADAAVSVAGLVEVSDDHDMPAAPSAADGGGPDLANDASDGAFMTGLVAESSVDLVDFNADVGRPCRLGGRKGRWRSLCSGRDGRAAHGRCHPIHCTCTPGLPS